MSKLPISSESVLLAQTITFEALDDPAYRGCSGIGTGIKIIDLFRTFPDAAFDKWFFAAFVNANFSTLAIDGSLDGMEQKLPSRFFFRVNRKFILHRQSIKTATATIST